MRVNNRQGGKARVREEIQQFYADIEESMKELRDLMQDIFDDGSSPQRWWPITAEDVM